MATPRLTAVILAGGFGKRLQSVVSDRPKPMALINGRPFLEYLFHYLKKQNIVSSIVLSVGYRSEQIQSYFNEQFDGIPVRYSIEDKPLGTGGAFKKAVEDINQSDILLLNGDTWFPVDLHRLYRIHSQQNADVTIALKYMRHIERYGTVECSNGRITRFIEKCSLDEGFINGGIYIIRKKAITMYPLPEVFSLENDFLQEHTTSLRLIGTPFENYFIDIGIPDDFRKANETLHLDVDVL